MTGAQRREQLLDVGRELFGERGLRGDLDRGDRGRADVSKPVVYEHFGGKEGLYAVVVDREMQLLLDRFTSALSAPGASPRSCCERAALVLLDYIEDDTDGFRVLTRDAPVTSGAGTLLLADRRGGPQGRAHPRASSSTPAGTTRGSPSSTARRWSAWSRWSGQWWLDTRTPDKHEVGRAPGQPGLQRPGPPGPARPTCVDRPGTGAAADARQPTRRAPGTGPWTARTVRNTPVAGQRRGQPDRGVGSSAASAATVGPGAADQRAAARPAPVVARSARRSSGPQRERRRLQVVAPAPPASAAAGPLRSAAMHRLGRRAAPRRRAARPAARSRSSSRVDRGRGQARPRRCRAPSAGARRASTGESCSPRPVPRATPPSRLNGTSLPSSRGQRQRGRPGWRGCPTARRGRPGRRRRPRCRRPARPRPGWPWRCRARRRRAPRRAGPAARRPARPGCGGRSGRVGPVGRRALAGHGRGTARPRAAR